MASKNKIIYYYSIKNIRTKRADFQRINRIRENKIFRKYLKFNNKYLKCLKVW